MTTINVLLINYDENALNTYAPLLTGEGITPCPASTMTEALNMLLNGEYSGIVINADNFEYLPYLKIMRALTPVPIGVAVSHYDKRERDAAIDSGANLYRPRYDDDAYRVKNFTGVVKIYLEFSKRQSFGLPSISYGDVLIVPNTRMAIVKSSEVELGRIEFEILCYLIANKGRIVTHGQIFSNVWGDEYADSSRSALWWNMSMLRKKLRIKANLSDLIKTKYGVGYIIDS